MNAFCFRNIQNNKLFFIILLVLFSLLSVYMPHVSIETHEHLDFKSLFKQVTNNSKPLMKLTKLLKKLRAFIFKIFRFKKALLSIAEKIKARLISKNMLFYKVSSLQLYSFLCCYFHTSKYKQVVKHSERLPLMAV